MMASMTEVFTVKTEQVSLLVVHSVLIQVNNVQMITLQLKLMELGL